jgi:hypothetical protein
VCSSCTYGGGSRWLWQAVLMGERWECSRVGGDLIEWWWVRDWCRRRGSLGCLKRGEEVVEGEHVGGHHGYEEQQVQICGETHRTLTLVDFNGFAYFCQNSAKTPFLKIYVFGLA